MKHINVKSSQVKSVAYDAKTNTLEVVFASGGAYTYAGVSPVEHAKLMGAKSIGSHLAQRIKGKYEFSKVGAKK